MSSSNRHCKVDLVHGGQEASRGSPNVPCLILELITTLQHNRGPPSATTTLTLNSVVVVALALFHTLLGVVGVVVLAMQEVYMCQRPRRHLRRWRVCKPQPQHKHNDLRSSNIITISRMVGIVLMRPAVWCRGRGQVQVQVQHPMRVL
jgi:hypothetical protein